MFIILIMVLILKNLQPLSNSGIGQCVCTQNIPALLCLQPMGAGYRYNFGRHIFNEKVEMTLI